MTEREVRNLLANAADAGDAIEAFTEDMEPGDFCIKALWGLGVMMAWYTDDGIRSVILEPEMSEYMSMAFEAEAKRCREDMGD